MKATLLYGAGDVRVEEVPYPEIAEPTDAIVKVVRTCVCGSDLHPYHSTPAGDEGTRMGHEYIGIVQEVGSEVSTVKKGDFVISPFAFSDNTCTFCTEGLHTSCPHGGFLSEAQAEYIRAPQADGSLVVAPGIDENTDPALLNSLLSLTDVYLTGYHAAVMGKVGPGKTVTVIGDGAVGLSAVLAAQQMGAEKIILMGRHKDRTDLGREWGATHVVSARGEEGINEVKELTDGEGSHIVLEAVGYMPAYEQAVGVVRPGGVISRVGVPQYEEAPIGFMSLFGKNVTLAGGPAPVRNYLEANLPLVLDGTIEPGRVFDRTVSLDEIASGYEAMEQREALKVAVTP